MDAVKAFLVGKSKFLFNIHTTNAFNISSFSSFPAEDEVLLPPGTYLEIINTMKLDSVTIVEMKEIPNSPFLRCPSNQTPAKNPSEVKKETTPPKQSASEIKAEPTPQELFEKGLLCFILFCSDSV